VYNYFQNEFIKPSNLNITFCYENHFLSMGNTWMKIDEIFHNGYIYVTTDVNEKMTQEDIDGIKVINLMIEERIIRTCPTCLRIVQYLL